MKDKTIILSSSVNKQCPDNDVHQGKKTVKFKRVITSMTLEIIVSHEDLTTIESDNYDQKCQY